MQVSNHALYLGRTPAQWWELFMSCHNMNALGPPQQWCHPYEGALLRQPYHVMEVFAVIRGQLMIHMKQKRSS